MMVSYYIIDLTHTLKATVPSWTMDCGYQVDIKLDYNDCDIDTKFRVQSICMNAGIGTHIDAPAHCVLGGMTVDQIPLEKLFVKVFCIDISYKMTVDYQVSLEDIKIFEKKHGVISKNSFVIFYTGWYQFWDNPQKYHNNYQYPTISKDVAKLLVKRQVAGIGIDTLSPDNLISKFSVHQILLNYGIYIIENIAYNAQVPKKGGYVSIMPLKGESLTEAPARVVCLISQNI